MPENATHAARDFIDNIAAQLESFRLEPIPLFSPEPHGSRPATGRAMSVALQGHERAGEEVFLNGKVVAMSDWEEASIGDPASDFAFAQDFFSELERDGRKIWGLQHALDYYHGVSGIRVTPEAVNYYRAVNSLKMLMYTHRAAVGTHSTPEASIRQAWTGTEVAHVAKRMMATTMGLTEPLPLSRFLELNMTVS